MICSLIILANGLELQNLHEESISIHLDLLSVQLFRGLD